MNLKENTRFSLTELSISVVIISILIAAVTTGISLQKQAQIRAIASEFNIIQSAVNSFKLQYSALPGDISNATVIWPSPIVTNNGNGDNIINWDGTSPSGVEDTYVFQHLYLGGVLSNPFSGGVQSTRYVRGVNSYPSKLFNAAYSIIYKTFYNLPTQNFIEYGTFGPDDSCAGHNNGAFMNAKDAYLFDLKLDDGFPNTGRYAQTRSCIYKFTNTCVDQTESYTTGNINYILSDTTTSCRILKSLD